MTKGTLQKDGTHCYSGPTCKLHGAHNQEIILRKKISGLFSKSTSAEVDSQVSSQRSNSYRELYNNAFKGMRNFNALSEQEKKEFAVVSSYIDKGFTSINICLRGSFPAQVADRTKYLDSFIEKQAVNTDGVLYRGSKHFPEINTMQKGDTFADKAYMSTTSNLNTAMIFTSANREEPPVLFRISTQKATPVNDIESEFLLLRDKEFVVSSVRKNVTIKGRTVTLVDLEEK